jgi:hypothetical protein
VLNSIYLGEAYVDIANKLYASNGTTHPSQQIYKVIAKGEPSCDPSPCVIRPFTSYNAISNIDLNILNASDIAADEANLYNVINVFYAGVRLDLGHWTVDNVCHIISSYLYMDFCLIHLQAVHQYHVLQTIGPEYKLS